MIDRAIDLITHRHQFWRNIKFTELSELYMSLTLRALSLSLIGIFVPVYLYEQGVLLEVIALLYALMSIIRLLTDVIAAKLVAKYGPRHVLRISYIFEVLFMLVVISVGNNALSVWLIAPVLGTMLSMFFIPFHADFSTVRSVKKIGKQLSSLTILEKTAGVLGPLAGGLIATAYGFEVTLLVAVVITAFAVMPLYMTSEFGGSRKFNYRFKLANYLDFKNIEVFIGRGAFIAMSTLFWPLFIAVAILGSQIYIGLGFITALGLAASLLSAYVVGKIVDNRKSRELMRIGTFVTVLTTISRPFVTTVLGASVLSVIAEPAGSAVQMPFMKGIYHDANHYKHGRVAYMVSVLSVLHLVRAALYLMLFIWLTFSSPQSALATAMFVAGILSSLTFLERFKAFGR